MTSYQVAWQLTGRARHKSWLFQVSIRNCLNCVHNCDDHSLLDFKIRSTIYETFHTSLHNMSVITQRDSVTPFEWNSIRMNVLQNQLKITNPEAFFSTSFFVTLNSIFVGYSLGWRGWEIITISSLIWSRYIPEIPRILILMCIALPGKILYEKNVAAFESNTKFRFLTSYDLKVIKLP